LAGADTGALELDVKAVTLVLVGVDPAPIADPVIVPVVGPVAEPVAIPVEVPVPVPANATAAAISLRAADIPTFGVWLSFFLGVNWLI